MMMMLMMTMVMMTTDMAASCYDGGLRTARGRLTLLPGRHQRGRGCTIETWGGSARHHAWLHV
eukprot:8221176-Pyramimonas_sp.AAC.1